MIQLGLLIGGYFEKYMGHPDFVKFRYQLGKKIQDSRLFVFSAEKGDVMAFDLVQDISVRICVERIFTGIGTWDDQRYD
ncbi:MAG: hypothetical protein R6U27_10955 [Desulfobacterales bacterium]